MDVDKFVETCGEVFDGFNGPWVLAWVDPYQVATEDIAAVPLPFDRLGPNATAQVRAIWADHADA
jgi:hypothetical protein